MGYMIKLITFNNGLFNFVLNIDYFYSGNAFFFHNFFEQVDVVYLVCNLTLSHRIEKRLGNKFDCSLSVSAVHSPSHVNIFRFVWKWYIFFMVTMPPSVLKSVAFIVPFQKEWKEFCYIEVNEKN